MTENIKNATKTAFEQCSGGVTHQGRPGRRTAGRLSTTPRRLQWRTDVEKRQASAERKWGYT